MAPTNQLSLDTPYQLNPRVVSSIRTPESLTVLGAEQPLELPLELFQLLMVFAKKQTARQAFQTLDVDVDLEEFARIIDDFVSWDLLRHEPPVVGERGLQDLLNPKISANQDLMKKIGGWLQQGRAIVIPDALPEEFAERIYHDLDHSTQWRVAEGGHDFFHYRGSVIEDVEGQSPALTECRQLFRNSATRRFIGELSGRDCSGDAGASAAWYRPGEYALPHEDSLSSDTRSVAYVWYLTKDWRREWGGALFWCPTGQYLSPQFNVLTIFNVTPANFHLVCPVALTATAKRLSINGFWRHQNTPPQPSRSSPDAAVSPWAYGPPPPNDPELSSVIVL